MTSTKETGLHLLDAPIQIVDFRSGSGVCPKLDPTAKILAVKQYHSDFGKVVGTTPRHSLLLSSEDTSMNPFFQNGCVWVSDGDQLYIMSDPLQPSNSSQLPVILISRVILHRAPDDSITAVDWLKLRSPENMVMPAGACRYKSGILYCSQGNLCPELGGLSYMRLGRPPTSILYGYFGTPFNSIQNVIEDLDGGLWFTDSDMGFERSIRPKPQLPNQVYRFDPKTNDLRVVADGFKKPAGIAISPNNDTLYITDIDAARPDGTTDRTRAATIYAFDVTRRFGSQFLTNRRTFAFAKEGVPRAVMCDDLGIVYAACGDGVEVWSPGGVALGVIEVPGGCTTLCFGENRELFIGAKQRLWMIQLQDK